MMRFIAKIESKSFAVTISANEDETLTPEQLQEIEDWCNTEQGTGKRMTDTLWSFRKESQRDWFVLRWS